MRLCDPGQETTMISGSGWARGRALQLTLGRYETWERAVNRRSDVKAAAKVPHVNISSAIFLHTRVSLN